MTIKFKKVNVRPKDSKAMGYPLLYMTGHHEFHWTDDEAAWLRRYLKAGGMLLADACCGRLAFHLAFQREIARVLPEHKLESLPLDHPLYHAHYDIQKVQYTPRVAEDFGAINAPSLSGISLDGRLAVVYSRFDLGNGWEQFPHPYTYGYGDKDAAGHRDQHDRHGRYTLRPHRRVRRAFGWRPPICPEVEGHGEPSERSQHPCPPRWKR